MSISDRLNQIEARAQAATPADAETSLSMDGFNMHEDYPEYGQGQLMNAYMLGYDEGCTDVPELVEAVRRRDAAIRAILDACSTYEKTQAIYGIEMGQREIIRVVRAEITAALGEGS